MNSKINLNKKNLNLNFKNLKENVKLQQSLKLKGMMIKKGKKKKTYLEIVGTKVNKHHFQKTQVHLQMQLLTKFVNFTIEQAQKLKVRTLKNKY